MERLIDKRLYDWMVTFRRDLHQFPELSWDERRTSRKIETTLNKWNIPNHRMSETGIIVDIPGPENVPIVALRGDIDALPIVEETGLPFSSHNHGIMHACGHDGHTAMLLATARILSRKKDLPAPVRLIFQPAEEQGTGAKAMIDDGVLKDVAMIFGGHLDRHFPTGTIAVTPGTVNAATDAFQIKITSSGGHAAKPHETVDAVVVGSLMVMALQTIVSREIDPAFPAVVSVGRFNAGTVGNSIAGQAILDGTIRTQEKTTRDHFQEAINRIATSVGKLHGANVEIKFDSSTPALKNDPKMSKLAREAGIRVVGERNIHRVAPANMGGEDFSYFMEEIPGCYIRFGANFDDRMNYPAHSSKFDFNEEAMAIGVAWYCEMAYVAGKYLVRSEDTNVAVV
jgi:amidohydrolase